MSVLVLKLEILECFLVLFFEVASNNIMNHCCFGEELPMCGTGGGAKPFSMKCITCHMVMSHGHGLLWPMVRK